MTLILSDDALLLFEIQEGSMGKLEFWSTLYAITDVQVNKMQKLASLNFYNDETMAEKSLKLRIDNILFFREALVKRMNNLKVKVESKKLIKGQMVEKRLSDREINTMDIPSAVKNIDFLVDKIKSGEANYYNVNTFMRLVGRAIEHYSSLNDEKNSYYLNLMKEILSREDVQNVTQEIQ